MGATVLFAAIQAPDCKHILPLQLESSDIWPKDGLQFTASIRAIFCGLLLFVICTIDGNFIIACHQIESTHVLQATPSIHSLYLQIAIGAFVMVRTLFSREASI